MRWRVEVGEGHAGPLVVGNAVYVFARRGEQEVAYRLDRATGRVIWTASYAAPYEMNPAARDHGKGPKATPVYHEGRLVTFGISGILSCLDAQTGKVLWRRDFAREHKATSPLFGTSASPLVLDGRVITHVGGHDDGALAAFDLRTGATVWRWQGDGPGYASPVAATLGGVRQIVTQTQQHIVGVEAGNGRLLWKLPFQTPYVQNIVDAVPLGSDLLCAGLQNPTFRVSFSRSGGTLTPNRVWEQRDATFYMSTPVLLEGRVVGFTDKQRGNLVVVDPASGRLLWSGDGRMGENASLTVAGSRLLVLTTDAVLRVLRLSGSGLSEERRYRVAEKPVWAYPAFSGKHLLVKDLAHLTLWEVGG